MSRRSWRRHQMETFSALLAICEGNSPVIGEFPAQRPVTRIFDVFFYLSKQSWGLWFETSSRSLWRHRNENSNPPSAAYMRRLTRPALVRVTTCRLFGTKQLLEPLPTYCQLDPQEKQTSVKFESNHKIFIHENAFENVACEMAAILSVGDEL